MSQIAGSAAPPQQRSMRACVSALAQMQRASMRRSAQSPQVPPGGQMVSDGSVRYVVDAQGQVIGGLPRSASQASAPQPLFPPPPEYSGVSQQQPSFVPEPPPVPPAPFASPPRSSPVGSEAVAGGAGFAAFAEVLAQQQRQHAQQMQSFVDVFLRQGPPAASSSGEAPQEQMQKSKTP
eukprot:gene44447-56971_t